MERPRIGIDFGGTKIEGIVLEGARNEPRIALRRRIPTEVEGGYEHLVARLAQFIDELGQKAGVARPYPVGVGMPGSVTRAGLVKNSNTVCLNGTPFRQAVQERLGQSILFANDANCFALAEAVMGAGRGHGLVFGVIMGTGTGGGIVVDGLVREGPQSIAGEWGHAVLRPDSERICYCGQPGCVETYLAGPWVERHYEKLSGSKRKMPEILARASTDPAARAALDCLLEHFGRALANLINTLDPDIVVLGGGLSQIDLLYTEGRAEVERYVFSDELLTPIVRHELGDSAGVFGAALLTAPEK
ncbi:MAG: ROK family protein [Myxococcota bacterium]|nr:ROK family protein [Myxococcota bacterium]